MRHFKICFIKFYFKLYHFNWGTYRIINFIQQLKLLTKLALIQGEPSFLIAINLGA